MQLQPVTSSNVFATGHEGDTMQVMYLNGALHAYAPITAEDHQKILDAASVGAAINRMQKTANGTPVEVAKLPWESEDDDMGNTTYTSPSPFHDGAPFFWRLKPRLSNNKVEWYECHDIELMDEAHPKGWDETTPQGWPTIGVAKTMIELKHAEIVKDSLQPTESKIKSLCDSCAPDDGPCELQHIGIVAVGGSCNRYQEVTPL